MTSVATAQEAPENPGKARIEEIVVTATRREQSVAEIPYNIQAITGDQLTKTEATVMSDYVRTVPGLSFIDRGPSAGMDIVLRGLRTTSVAGSQPTTSVYLDDIEIPAAYDPRIVDIARVEVLRGPQGTLYGGGAIGGTIRYISEKPVFNTWAGNVTGKFGSTQHGGDNIGASGMLNAPLVDDRLALRANVSYFDNSGFVDNVRLGKKDVNDDRAVTGRLSLLAKPSDNLELSLSYLVQNSDFGSDGIIDEDVGKFANTKYFLGGVNADRDLTNLTASYDFGFARLTSSTPYTRSDEEGSRDNTNFIRDVVYPLYYLPDEIPEITSLATTVSEVRYLTEELRLVSNSDGPLSWIAGAYWAQNKNHYWSQENVPIPFPGQAEFEQLIGSSITDTKDYYYESHEKFEQTAVFGELGYALTPRLKASLGARYFRYKSSAEFFAIDQYSANGRNPDGTARTEPLPDEYSVGEAKESDTIFRFNASYDLTTDALAYLTVAQGYRPGGYNLVGKNTGVSPSQFTYKPDNIVNYELGVKSSLLDRKVYLSTAVYYIDWKDIQTNVFTSTGFILAGNAGKAHSSGVEIEFSARDLFAEGMTLSAGYAFTDTKLDETVAGLGFDGESAPYVPRHAGSAGVDYAFPITAGIEGGLNLMATYTGDSATDFGPLRPNEAGEGTPNVQYLDLDAYWLVDISARVTHGAWTARLGLDNALDEYADMQRAYRDANSPYRGPFVYRTVNRPRTLSLSISHQF